MADEYHFEKDDGDSTLELLGAILDISPSEQTELVLECEEESLTRFANNQVHQNVKESSLTLSIRSIVNGHIGYSSTNHLDRHSVRRALEWADGVACSGRIPAQPAEFAAIQKYASINNYSQTTAKFSPEKRAQIVKNLVDECLSAGMEAAGAVSNSENTLAIANSNGVRAYHATTDSNFTATVSAAGSTGWCDCYSIDASELQFEAMGRHALKRAVAGKNPRKIEPGKYTVILEEAPVKDFVDFMCWLGFGAQSFEEGRSFMCNKMGKRITGGNITVTDDVFHPLASGYPFDYEGVPRQPVVLIQNGIAEGVVYDRTTAARAGRTSTGHALPSHFSYGPLPANPVMAPGESDLERMLKSVKRGLLISRFWYCRVVDPAKTLLTGQTRDGTLLIEDGEIVCAVGDMRFNESVLDAFARAEMISRDVRRIGSTIVPAMKISDFHFTEAVGMK